MDVTALLFHSSPALLQPADNQTLIGVVMLRVLFGYVIVVLGVSSARLLQEDDCESACVGVVQAT